MIPVLYAANTADFSSFGICVLTDTISCEVTEERNGVFECLLKYPVSGQHYGLITKECIIKAKPNDTATDQAFRIYHHKQGQEDQQPAAAQERQRPHGGGNSRGARYAR